MEEFIAKNGLQAVLTELLLIAAKQITPIEFGYRVLHESAANLNQILYSLDLAKRNRSA